MGKAVLTRGVQRGCAAGAALGETLGAFPSVCSASIPEIPGHQGTFATAKLIPWSSLLLWYLFPC